jgi:hypothetical protein
MDSGHRGSHDSATEGTHERGLPELLQKVARTMGKVFEARGINGNVSFTVIYFLFEHSPIF